MFVLLFFLCIHIVPLIQILSRIIHSFYTVYFIYNNIPRTDVCFEVVGMLSANNVSKTAKAKRTVNT